MKKTGHMMEMGHHPYLHKIAMLIIVVGAIILFYLSFVWYQRSNFIMSVGMFVMGLIAVSNFYLHGRMMKKMSFD